MKCPECGDSLILEAKIWMRFGLSETGVIERVLNVEGDTFDALCDTTENDTSSIMLYCRECGAEFNPILSGKNIYQVIGVCPDGADYETERIRLHALEAIK